ncbi:MAG: TonB family protein [Gammaproteobacteria bacterium]|nr:TonB family protein [Gammaproteobacteria bacterium]
MTALYHSYVLPWTAIPEEDTRLKRNLQIALVLALIFGLVVPFLPVKKIDKTQIEELPPRLAQLVVEKQKPKPPPPPEKVEKKEKPKEKKKEEKKEKPKEEPKPEPKEKSQAELVAEARKKAASTGLLALSDELSDLRDTTPQLNKSKPLAKGATQAKTVQRSILTSGVASAGSGGIDTSSLSSGVGRSSLAGRQTTQVDSPVEQVAQNARIESDKRSNKASRTYEEVSLVFDKNKGAIYALYNRELRTDPTLQGKIVFEITIDPAGNVTDVKIVSSELNSPELEKKLLARIRLFNFGPKEVETLIVTYPIDFLPP